MSPAFARARILGLAAALLLAAAASSAPGRQITIKGSDTIGGKLGPALAEAFSASHPGSLVDWQSLGSGTAFVGLFDGSAQLGASSRPVKDAELEKARAMGITLSEYVLGFDGIAVIVHPSNPVGHLTIGELSRVFTGAVTRWSELGGPDRPILVISRPSYSGTHAFFKDAVLRRGDKHGPEEFSPAARFVEENRDIVGMVGREPGAVSYVGLGWVSREVKALGVSPGEGAAPVVPSPATVRDGSYPVYRSLLLYSRGEPGGLARDLLAFALSPRGQQIVAAHDFIPSETALPVARGSASPSTVASVLRIQFPFGGVHLGPLDLQRLDRLAARLRGNRHSVLVTGHGDSVGPRAANLAVSKARAEAVARELVARGIPPARLMVEGKGFDEPVATNNTVEGRRLNRRVEILVLPAP